ncbi:MAG: MOSC domain-containing protein [Planctomycetota bacterium]
MTHPSRSDLDAGLDHVRASPSESGTLELIVRRPAEDARETLEEGRLDLDTGLVGDNWATRGSRRTEDGSSHPDMQLNVMNARAAELIAGSKERWGLAGDQLYIDFNLSEDNVPPGTQLAIGDAIIEVTDQPHTGCKKFVERFGMPAMEWISNPVGKALHLRGVNARVVQPGAIRSGDSVRRL